MRVRDEKYRILVGKSEWKRAFGGPMSRSDDDIKIDRNRMRGCGLDSSGLG
jgi:hypothetical protein